MVSQLRADLDEELEKEPEDYPEWFLIDGVRPPASVEGELHEEASWIFQQLFSGDASESWSAAPYRLPRHDAIVQAIHWVLEMVRVEHADLPFLAVYRKDYIWCLCSFLAVGDATAGGSSGASSGPLDERRAQLEKTESEHGALRDQYFLERMDMLFRIWRLNRRWISITERRRRVHRLLQRVQESSVTAQNEPRASLISYLKQRVGEADTEAALCDVMDAVRFHFDVDWRDGDAGQSDAAPHLRQRRRDDKYHLCCSFGIESVTALFGLTAQEVGENVMLNYRRHTVRRMTEQEPMAAAMGLVNSAFGDPANILAAARYMMAAQLAVDPRMRRALRQILRERGLLSVRPTALGMQTIDEWHAYAPIKFITNKPLRVSGDANILLIRKAEMEGMLTVHVTLDAFEGPSRTLDDMCHLFADDSHVRVASLWNEQRAMALRFAVDKILLPRLAREALSELERSAHETVARICADRLFSRLAVQPYPAGASARSGGVEHRGPGNAAYDNDSVDVDAGVAHVGTGTSIEALANAARGRTRRVHQHQHQSRHEAGLARVMACYPGSMIQNLPAFIAMLDPNGDVVDFLKLGHMYDRGATLDAMTPQKEENLAVLEQFIRKHRPDVIAVSAENINSRSFVQDVYRIVDRLHIAVAATATAPVATAAAPAEGHATDEAPASAAPVDAPIPVEAVTPELGRIFASSYRAEQEFNYPVGLRHAIGVGRMMQDPLAAYAALCFRSDASNADGSTADELLALSLHPLQSAVPPALLQERLHQCFRTVVAHVGVDINRCVRYAHSAGTLPFVSGLGPRAAKQLRLAITLKQGRLDSREELLSEYDMPPKVWRCRQRAAAACMLSTWAYGSNSVSETVPDSYVSTGSTCWTARACIRRRTNMRAKSYVASPQHAAHAARRSARSVPLTDCAARLRRATVVGRRRVCGRPGDAGRLRAEHRLQRRATSTATATRTMCGSLANT